MKSSLWSVLSAAAISALSVTYWIGCTEDPAGPSSDVFGPEESSLSRAGSELTFDDQLADVAKSVPGFGGMFISEDGALELLLLEGTQASLAENAISAVFQLDAVPRGKVRVRPAQYGFVQLKQWHDAVSTDVLSLNGVVFTDLDESKNRLRIGVENSGMQKAVENKLAVSGVPQEAVIIEVTDPVRLETSLRDRHRPLVGGLQINFGNFLCTLGFIANRQGIRGFVTNSHCTNVQGGVEGTVYHQHTASGTTNRVGRELADPTYFTGGVCPAGRRCRRSDAAFVRVPHPSGPATTSTLGRIARPNLGSFAWNGANLFSIVGTGNPLMGASVTKVGRTTGRTRGTVNLTCTNFNVSGTNITQLCQARASYLSSPGDSGSPVFGIVSSVSNTARLRGIHWGSGGVFSPIGNITLASELGALVVF